jgi:hypothetical protein
LIAEGEEGEGTARERCVCALFGLSEDGGEVESGGTCIGGRVVFFARGVVLLMKPDRVGDEGETEVGVAGEAGLPVPSDSGDLSL